MCIHPQGVRISTFPAICYQDTLQGDSSGAIRFMLGFKIDTVSNLLF